MARSISRSNSEKGRAIWEGVSHAARSTPDWVKPQVKQAATRSANRIVGRDTYKYQFKDGNKIVHQGITDDLDRREAEHQRDYNLPGGHITQVGRQTTRDAALKWERDGSTR